jgi:type IV pilus assembly protein PilW
VTSTGRIHAAPLTLRAAGLTLVELLVAMVIGMVVVLLSISAYLTMSRTAVAQDESSRIEQNGRLALEQVARVIRMAGYRDWNESRAVPPGAGAASISGTDGVGATGYDTLVVRYYGSAPAATGGTADTVLDCVGAGVGAAVQIQSTITAADAAPGRLTCSPRAGAGAETLATNIEQVQFLYGIHRNDLHAANPDEAEVIDGFVPASAVTDWSAIAVVAVRVAIVVSGSPGSAIGAPDSQTYRLFGDAYANAADAGATYTPPAALRDRARRVFTQTVRLRNFAGVSAI